jgi:hypothetical protein
MKSENHNSYDERNFENLVYIYEKELRRILQGVSVSKILSNRERGSLLRSGVIIRRGRGTHVQYEVSKKALDSLLKMEKTSRNKIS